MVSLCVLEAPCGCVLWTVAFPQCSVYYCTVHLHLLYLLGPGGWGLGPGRHQTRYPGHGVEWGRGPGELWNLSGQFCWLRNCLVMMIVMSELVCLQVSVPQCLLSPVSMILQNINVKKQNHIASFFTMSLMTHSPSIHGREVNTFNLSTACTRPTVLHIGIYGWNVWLLQPLKTYNKLTLQAQ